MPRPPVSPPIPASAPRTVIATEDVAPKDRFDWWRSQFAPLHATEVAHDQRAGFRARSEHVRLGSMLIGHYITPARHVVRAIADIRRDDIDNFSLRVMLRGTVVSHTSRRSVVCRAGQVIFATSAETYRDEYSQGEWIALSIPRASFPALARVPPGLVTGVRGGLLSDYLLSLGRRLDEARPSDLPALTQMTRAMLHACVIGDDAPAGLDPAERRTVLRLGVERAILANLGSARLDATRISALAGLSRSTLYRLFEEEGGVASHVQTLRLKSIDADLRDPALGEATIAALAARRGLHNPAAFTRAYRREFGHTPSETRTHASAAAASRQAAPPVLARTFLELLR